MENNNQNIPPIFNSILNIEASRKTVITSANYMLTRSNTNKLNNELINTKFSNPTRNDNTYVNCIDNLTGLENIAPEIIKYMSAWKPVMQIARSANGTSKGYYNYPTGTAPIITMYNGESKDLFFTTDDTKNDENNIPLCFFGYDLNNPTSQSAIYNKVPNSPIFNKYSKKSSTLYKAGYLFPSPNNTTSSNGTVLYYQFTFPYNCYLYITVNASTNWNSVESSGCGEPVAFMINDENGNNIVSRTSYDDGTGNYVEGKNRYFGTIYWHGYVKKGWKFYYAEQVSALTGISKNGYNCIVFKVDNNYLTTNTSDANILTMSKFSTSENYNTSSDITVNVNNTIDLSKILIDSESKLTKLSTKTIIPNTPIFSEYSKQNSKAGTLFPAPGTNDKYGFWATLKIPRTCYMNFSLGGVDGSESAGIYALMIYDEKNNKILAKTSYDDGNGNNDANKNRYWGNIHYTGILKTGYTVYFAWINNQAKPTANNAITFSGFLLNLFNLPPLNILQKTRTLTATNYQTAIIYDSVTNTTITESNQVIPKDVLNLVNACINLGFANGQEYNCFEPKLYTSIEADYDSIAIISLPNSTSNGRWRVHSFYIHINNSNSIISYKYSGAGPINSNLSITEKIKVNTGDKIYVFIVAGDRDFPNSLHYGFASVTLIPTCYITENH